MTWQIGVVLALVVGLFGAGYYCGHLKGKAQVEAMQASSFKALADAYAQQQADHAKKETSYEKEIAELQSTVLTDYPNVPVRLCDNPTPAAVPIVHATGQKLPSATGVLSQNDVPNSDRPSRDVGDALFHLADEADALVAKCREE